MSADAELTEIAAVVHRCGVDEAIVVTDTYEHEPWTESYERVAAWLNSGDRRIAL
jgi:hypothetical protein